MAASILAEKSTKNKTISKEFFPSLTIYSELFDIADHESEVRTWKCVDPIWRIQYGGPVSTAKQQKNKRISNELFSSLKSYSGVLDVAYHEYVIWSVLENSQIQYGGSNMAAPIITVKSTKNKKISMELFSGLISYSGIFNVADHKSEIRIWKFV